MREDQLERLREAQEKAADHAIEAIDMAHSECDLTTKEGRGDRVWLTKSANESLKAVCMVERLFQMRNQGKPIPNPDHEAAAAEALLKRAQDKYEAHTKTKQ